MNPRKSFNVSMLCIVQVKDKAGLEKWENYNTGAGEGKVFSCPPKKKKTIMDAFSHKNLKFIIKTTS